MADVQDKCSKENNLKSDLDYNKKFSDLAENEMVRKLGILYIYFQSYVNYQYFVGFL